MIGAVIGRKREIEILQKKYGSNRAEFVAIYGRWRIGKTYLVSQVFENKITFAHAGLAPVDEKGKSKKEQLKSFYLSLKLYGYQGRRMPADWLEAFFMLENLLMEKDDGKRLLVFIDELLWMDTRRSGFITALESFWNNWCCRRNNILLIVCGSATSWMLDKLIHNHEGLYNRLTCQLKLSPFCLNECEEYYRSIGVNMSRYDIVQSYMVMGGIPYYMGYLDIRMSLAQNIDALFFKKNALLTDEYGHLFSSIFTNPEEMKRIVEFLSGKNAGYSRKEILQGLGIKDGGELSEKLKVLLASDFVREYIPFGIPGKVKHYKLVDPFILFYLHFIKGQAKLGGNDWQSRQSSQSVITWRGYAFENVCFHHIEQIKSGLQILGVITEESAWSKRSDDTEGTQIDLLIERKDNVVNSCEIKFDSQEFIVDKQYYMTLLSRQNILQEKISRKSAVHNTLIIIFGLKKNEYSSIFVNVITMDDLFKEL